MKEFFRQHGLRILAVAAAVAVALSLLTYFSSTSSVLENIAGVLTEAIVGTGRRLPEIIQISMISRLEIIP